MIIGVDLDEVLADLLSAFLIYYNNKHHTALKKGDFHSYRWWETLHCSREEAIAEVYQFWNTHYANIILPVKDAVETTKSLANQHQLVIITSRQIDFKEKTNEWIKKYFPGVFSGMYFTNHLAKSGRIQSKSEICHKLRVDLLIEDDLDHALHCAAAKTHVLLLDAPWNKLALSPPCISRVSSWHEVAQVVTEFSNREK
jgi:uncharacterized protein